MNRILLLLIILSFFSCSKDDQEGSTTHSKQEIKQTTTNLDAVDVSLLDADRFQALLDQYKGKVLFINTWATWCVPCKEEFPDLVRLQDHYKDDDVVFIGISVDFPDEIESKVKPFLHSQKVNFANYVQNFKDPAELIDLLNTKWRGAVPATFIYDKKGIQQTFLLGKHSFVEFQQAIETIRNTN